jgi:hypothetical protein
MCILRVDMAWLHIIVPTIFLFFLPRKSKPPCILTEEMELKKHQVRKETKKE